jgi:hypothetical protein
MEFNRLLSSAISAYGETNPSNIRKEGKIPKIKKQIEKKEYFF